VLGKNKIFYMLPPWCEAQYTYIRHCEEILSVYTHLFTSDFSRIGEYNAGGGGASFFLLSDACCVSSGRLTLLGKDMEGCCTVLVSDPETYKPILVTTKGKETWIRSWHLWTVLISATISIKLKIKPTQAQSPAQNMTTTMMMMMYFIKNEFNLALMTTTSVLMHISDKQLATCDISDIRGLWDDSCR
jgi:hypothetical protein